MHDWATFGGWAQALINGQVVESAIDGIEHVDGRSASGWSFQGRLEAAYAMFALGSLPREDGLHSGFHVSSLKVVTGVVARDDLRAAVIRLWATNSSSPSLPPEWYDDARTRVPELFGWRQILPTEVLAYEGDTARTAGLYNGRIYLGGESRVRVFFEPLDATAILLKVDGVINREHRDSRSKGHLPDHTDAVIAELGVFLADPTGVESRTSPRLGTADEGSSGRFPGHATSVQRAECGEEPVEGFDFYAILGPFNTGLWSDEQGAGPDITKCDADAEWRVGPSSRLLASALGEGEVSSDARAAKADWEQGARDIESMCEGLEGLELIMAGDARMRHAFLATAAYFR